MNVPIDLMIKIIDESEECRSHITALYGYEYEVYKNYSTKNGTGCPFARAALKRIFQLEYQRRGKQFLASLGSASWGSKKSEEDDGRLFD